MKILGKNRYPQPHGQPTVESPPALEQILCELASPDEAVRAGAVRQLCPCRGSDWGVPVFQRVFELRNDPSPVVRHAVQHDLTENRWWGERQEARRLEGRQVRQEMERVKQEIEAAGAVDSPAPHSLGWRMPRRPRARKRHYPAGKK